MTPPGQTRKPRRRTPAKGKGNGAVKLDDLSPADRAAVLKEARGEIAGPVSEDAEQGAARSAAMRSLMDPRDHMRNCPVGEPEYDGDGRVEVYAQRKPPVADKETGIVVEGAREVTVAHCIECGGTCVIDDPLATVLTRLDEEVEVA